MPKNAHPNTCPACGGRWNHLQMKCESCHISEQPSRITPVSRTPFRNRLNESIKRSSDLQLTREDIHQLTGLNTAEIKRVLEGYNVSISTADDFIVGIANATRPLPFKG